MHEPFQLASLLGLPKSIIMIRLDFVHIVFHEGNPYRGFSMSVLHY